MRGKLIAKDVKDQILNRIKNDGISVIQAARDHGISEGTIYSWIAKKVEGHSNVAETIKLKRENEMLLRLVGEMTLRLSESQKKR
jgi:transposase-like protein